MKIAIVNDIHVGNPLECKKKMRAASHLVEEALPHILNHISSQHAPDIIINLGDLIRGESENADLEHYQQALIHFNKVRCPVIHLIGNHELKYMSSQDVEKIWKEEGFSQKSYGVREVNGYNLIWLGMQSDRHDRFRHWLPDEQFTWLNETLQTIEQPAIIFTHCALDNHDVNGNFFYEGYDVKDSRGFFLENCVAIQSAISKCPYVEMVVQAHMHYFHTKTIDHVPYVTCPAMGDNICGPNTSDHIPEIYSILNLHDNRLTLKAYSREYCFAGSEFDRVK